MVHHILILFCGEFIPKEWAMPTVKFMHEAADTLFCSAPVVSVEYTASWSAFLAPDRVAYGVLIHIREAGVPMITYHDVLYI